MADERWLIVGLGNPGKRYENTWHNLGRLALQTLADRHHLSVNKIRFKALTAEGFICGQPVLLLAPETFMNLSGESVRAAAEYYKIPREKIIVLYDDIDLDVGMLRIKGQGGAGTHKGMKSIIYQLSSENFPRIRIGMGPRPVGDMVDIVLAKIPSSDHKIVQESLDAAAESCELIIQGEIATAQERYNHKKELD
ncbi:MAG TPA: aminoacyl-tRNA hydrolase [Oscillospiraceae bacterium]|nr:aminoacyl-tRNA hydrolase [Oscillospiraceae bacterium]